MNNLPNSDIKRQLEETDEDLKKSEMRHSNIMQEIIGSYITFEKSLLQNRIKSILEADDRSVLDEIKQKYDKDLIIQRDIADEVFYVYQKGAIRSMYTLNMSTAGAIVNIILSSLNDDIFSYLNSKISMFAAKSKKNAETNSIFNFALKKNDERQRAGFSAKYTQYNSCLIAYLNTYQTCIEYIEKLKFQLVEELDGLIEETEITFQDFKNSFNSSLEATIFFQKTMFKTSLDFCSETQKQCNEEIEEKLNFLYTPEFTEVIDNLLKELSKLDLNLDDKKYEYYEKDDPFYNKFGHAIQKIIAQWSSQLLQDLFDKFIKNFTSYVAKMFLKMALLSSPHKLSLLGALYLDKLVRSMVNFFQFLTQKPIRNEFERPLEAVQVLSFETNEELEEYLEEQSEGRKKLTKEEVSGLIFRRTDFHIFKCIQ